MAMTKFLCGLGYFNFEVMPLRLMNAPFTCQRIIVKIFSDLIDIRVYLDDIVFASERAEERVVHLKEVLWRIKVAGIKIKVQVCVHREGDQYFGS